MRVNALALVALLVLSVAFFIPRLQAAQQATIFQKTWGAGGDELGASVVRDANGDIYVTGAYNYGFHLPYHNTSDVLLLKYDAYGNLVWVRSWGGSKEDVGFSDAVDSSGNIYIAGWTASYGAGSYDALLLKFSPSGALLWQKTWGSTGFDQAWGVTLDPSGNIYLTGLYNSTSGSRLFLLKLDSSGALQSQQFWNAPSSFGYSVISDSSGNIYAAGFFSNATGHDAVLLKFSPLGSLVWQRVWGNWTAEGTHVTLDSSGNVYLTGLYNPSSTSNSFLVKLDSHGALLWQRVYAQGEGTGVAVDSSGAVYNSGWRYRTTNSTAADVFLLKLDSTGNLLAQDLWGASATSLGYGVAADNAGHAIVTGFINGTGPFAISSTAYTLSNPGIKVGFTGYGISTTSLSLNSLSVAAVTPSGSEEYGGGFDSFVFEYGAAAVSCGQSCTASFQSNATITGASYNSSSNALHLTFTGTSGTHGYANVTIPKSAVQSQDSSNIKVVVNQMPLQSSALTIRMNSTHFFVYFTFTFHSDVNAEISFGIIVNITPGIALAALLLIAPVLLRIRRSGLKKH